jgi:hypothetical protein
LQSDYNKPKQKVKAKKVTSIDPKYLPPKPDDPNIILSEDPKTIEFMLIRQANMKANEQRAKDYAKKLEENRQAMEEYEKKQREYKKLQLERIAKLPGQQFEIFASGQRFTCSYCHIPLNFEAFCPNRTCQAQTEISTEPLMMRISQELSTSIRLDEPTRARLDKIRRPEDKTYQDIINRLLDNYNNKQ